MVDTFQLQSKYSVVASAFSSSWLVPIVLNAACSLYFCEQAWHFAESKQELNSSMGGAWGQPESIVGWIEEKPFEGHVKFSGSYWNPSEYAMVESNEGLWKCVDA